MEGADNRNLVRRGQAPERLDQIVQLVLTINVFGAMHGRKDVFAVRHAKSLQCVRGANRLGIAVQDLFDRVPRHINPPPVDPFTHKVLAAAVRVRQQHAARVVDHAAIHFLGHSIVIASVSCLHVKHWNPETPGDDRRQAAVRIAKNQQPIRPVLDEERLGFRQDLPKLLAECLAPDTHEMVRFANPELPKEQTVEAIVVVLTGVNEHVVGVRIEHAG